MPDSILTQDILASQVTITGCTMTPKEGAVLTRLQLSMPATGELLKELDIYGCVYTQTVDKAGKVSEHRIPFESMNLDLEAKACSLSLFVKDLPTRLEAHVDQVDNFELKQMEDGLVLRFRVSTTGANASITDFLQAVTITACQMRLKPLAVQNTLPNIEPVDISRVAAKATTAAKKGSVQ